MTTVQNLLIQALKRSATHNSDIEVSPVCILWPDKKHQWEAIIPTLRGGLIVVGEIALGGSIEPIHNAVTLAEIAIEKGATALLMPVTCRRQLLDLPDDMAIKIDIQFYSDARDALLKAMVE